MRSAHRLPTSERIHGCVMRTTTPALNHRFTLLILAGWALVTGLISAGASLLERLMPATAISAGVLVPTAQGLLAPEPVERAVFLGALVVVPPLLLALLIWATPSSLLRLRLPRWSNNPLDAPRRTHGQSH